MGKVIVMNGLTLDGVMQAPGRPDEDTRGGFEHGGWAVPYLISIAPLVLGAGRRMFPDGVRTSVRLTDGMTTGKGAIIATYESS
jgi:hypothetical protein